MDLLGLVVDNRYRLDTVLGRGGMGLVFRATHLEMNRDVAVKILHPSLAASHDVRSRFEREALAVGKIDHPNCVATFDVGRLADGSLYLAMELLEGRSLADVLEHEGQLPPKRALHILRHILRGLSSIHNAGLIHRDIKPDNIFLVRQGDDADFAKILDFGIAKPVEGELVDDGVRLTQAGMAFGTPIYMSPEQAIGNKLDGRADLYAAAVIGYEMLVGQLPFFSDDRLEVMSMHVAKPVPAMSTRLHKEGRAVPPAVERLIANGLTKKPDDRYACADDFIAAVDDALRSLEFDVASVRQRNVANAQPAAVGVKSIGNDSSHAIDELLLQLPIAPTSPPPPSLPQTSQPPPPQGPGTNIPPNSERSRWKGRWIPSSITLAGAVILGIAAAFLTAPENGAAPIIDIPPSLPDQVAQLALAQRVEEPKSDPPPSDDTKPANDAHDQLSLGHAHAARRDTAAALDAYDKALSLAPALSTDATLRTNLASMTRSGNPELATRAFTMWLGSTDDPAATDAVLKAAVSKSLDRRHIARPLIDRFKLASRVDWVTSYGLDLEQDLTCKNRRAAVARLRALKKPTATTALERAIVKRQRRRNACLIQDARAAIKFLKRIAPARK